MNGILLYNREDYGINKTYVNWLIEEGKSRDLNLSLVLREDFLISGIEKDYKPDFLINRTRSYEISLMFELNGVRVFNDSLVTLLGNNKLAGYKYALDKGYDFSPILIDWNNKNKIISKPNFGHGGEGIDLLENIDLESQETRLQQKLVENMQGDIRFYIIDNKIIHGVMRSSKDKLISNFTKGGTMAYYDYSNKEKEYVEAFIKDIRVDYAGLDFFLTKDNKLIFNEIEDVVGSRMLSHLGINNTTDLYLDHIYKALKKTN